MLSPLEFDDDEKLWTALTERARSEGFTSEQIAAARRWAKNMQLHTANAEFLRGLEKARQIIGDKPKLKLV